MKATTEIFDNFYLGKVPVIWKGGTTSALYKNINGQASKINFRYLSVGDPEGVQEAAGGSLEPPSANLILFLFWQNNAEVVILRMHPRSKRIQKFSFLSAFIWM